MTVSKLRLCLCQICPSTLSTASTSPHTIIRDSQYQHPRTLHHPPNIPSKSNTTSFPTPIPPPERSCRKSTNTHQSHSRHNSHLSIPIPIPNSKSLLASSQKQARFQYFSLSRSNLSPASRAIHQKLSPPNRPEGSIKWKSAPQLSLGLSFYQQRTPALSGHTGLPVLEPLVQ